MGSQSLSSESWLGQASIAPEIFDLRPDYVAGVAVATGIAGGEGDSESERLLTEAEEAARLAEGDSESALHWRDTFRLFGLKPRKARSSVDALTQRALKGGLPRINRLTDAYNAVSVIRQVPIGAEDVDRYDGPLRLVIATGEEEYLTKRGGEAVNEPPKSGEPVWRDDRGVTCRRWNWRQTTRTALTSTSTNVVFIVDALGAGATQLVLETLADLRTHAAGESAEWHQRVITRGPS